MWIWRQKPIHIVHTCLLLVNLTYTRNNPIYQTHCLQYSNRPLDGAVSLHPEQKSNLVTHKCHTLPSAIDDLSINRVVKSYKCLINT